MADTHRVCLNGDLESEIFLSCCDFGKLILSDQLNKNKQADAIVRLYDQIALMQLFADPAAVQSLGSSDVFQPGNTARCA